MPHISTSLPLLKVQKALANSQTENTLCRPSNRYADTPCVKFIYLTFLTRAQWLNHDSLTPSYCVRLVALDAWLAPSSMPPIANSPQIALLHIGILAQKQTLCSTLPCILNVRFSSTQPSYPPGASSHGYVFFSLPVFGLAPQQP